MFDRLLSTTRYLFREFIYGGHLQSLGASGLLAMTARLLDKTAVVSSMIAIYFLFYSIYLYNRYKEIRHDEKTNPDRTIHFLQYYRIMPALISIVIIAHFLIVFMYANNVTLVFSLLLLIFGFLYTTLFKQLTQYIPALKNYYVALFFSSMPLYYVAYYGMPSVTLSVWLFVMVIFVKAFAMQVVLDIKDIASDKLSHLKTIPSMLGKQHTITLSNYLLVLVNICLPIIFIAILKLLPSEFYVIIAGYPLMLYALSRIQQNNYFGYVLASAEFTVWFLILAILSATFI